MTRRLRAFKKIYLEMVDDIVAHLEAQSRPNLSIELRGIRVLFIEY